MKETTDIVIESMACRIRELEGLVAEQHKKSEALYEYNAGIKLAFSAYIRSSNATTTTNTASILNFEKYMMERIESRTITQPDFLDAYLYVMEIAIDNGDIEPSDDGLVSEADYKRIEDNIEKFNKTLDSWKKTQ